MAFRPGQQFPFRSSCSRASVVGERSRPGCRHFPAGLGAPWWVGILAGIGILVGTINLGRWLDDRFRGFGFFAFTAPCSGGRMAKSRKSTSASASSPRTSSRESAPAMRTKCWSSATAWERFDDSTGRRSWKSSRTSAGQSGVFVGFIGNRLPLVSLLPGASRHTCGPRIRRHRARVLAGFFFASRRRERAVGDVVKVSGVSSPPGIPVLSGSPVRIVKMFPPDGYAVIKKGHFPRSLPIYHGRRVADRLRFFRDHRRPRLPRQPLPEALPVPFPDSHGLPTTLPHAAGPVLEAFPPNLFKRGRSSWLATLDEGSYSGKMSRVRLPGVQLFLVKFPDLIKEVLVDRFATFRNTSSRRPRSSRC